MKKLLILMLLGVLFVPTNGSAKADEVLYCQSELATGMIEKNGTWRTSGFEEKRFTVKVIGDFKKVKGLFAGRNFDCDIPYSSHKHQVVCSYKSGTSFFYDKITRRFLFANITTSTYLDGDTPALFAGTCEKF